MRNIPTGRYGLSSPIPLAARQTLLRATLQNFLKRRWASPSSSRMWAAPAVIPAPARRKCATPDGYTLLVGAGSELLIRNLMQPAPVADPLRGFTPISLIGAGPMVVVGKPDLKAVDLKAVVLLSKDQSNGLNYGSAGYGTFMHLVGEAVKFRTSCQK